MNKIEGISIGGKTFGVDPEQDIEWALGPSCITIRLEFQMGEEEYKKMLQYVEGTDTNE